MSNSDTTRAMPCSCESEFQDSRYGKGMRVHNQGKGKVSGVIWRCSVCNKEK